jgi:uncharacterized protein (DUF2062 family)
MLNRKAKFTLHLRHILKINDSPHKIAFGLGLGVFLGIFPGTGILAALVLSWILRVNKTSAIIGTLITNTWLSIGTFILSIKIGSALLKIDWQVIYNQWNAFIETFHWQHLFAPAILNIILPIMLGYVIIAFGFGCIVYVLSFSLITIYKKGVKAHENQDRTNLSRGTKS